MRGKTANVQVIGKYIPMKVRQKRFLLNITNAEIFIKNYTFREELLSG
jgi:hypothetical protein